MRNFWRAQGSESVDKRRDAGLLALCVGIIALLFTYNRQPYSAVSWAHSPPQVLRTHEEYLLVNCCALLLPLVALLSAGGRLAPYGIGRGNRWGWKMAGVCYLLMLPLLWWAAGRPDFQQTYPLYRMARYSTSALLYHELTYSFYLWCWEMFFRGVLTSICWRWMGWAGVVLQSLVFALMHVGKPIPEVAGSFVAGVVLGTIAIRTGSFLPGFVCHGLVSATMDIFVLVRTGAL